MFDPPSHYFEAWSTTLSWKITVFSNFVTMVDKVSLKLCFYKRLMEKTPTSSETNVLNYVQHHSVSVDMPSILRPAQLTHPFPVTITANADRPFSLAHSTSLESQQIWAWETNTCLLSTVKIKVTRQQLRDNQRNDEWPCLLVKVGRMSYSMNESVGPEYSLISEGVRRDWQA